VCRSALLLGSTPNLLQQAQIIVSLPLLYDLAAFDAVHGEAFELYLLASRRAELLYISLVSTAYRPAGDGFITFGYHIRNGYVQVGEGGFAPGDKLLGLLQALDLLVWFVPDDIGGVKLVDEVRVIHDFPRAAR
jgi:hypothetical protein